MAFSNTLPVLGSDNQLLYNATIATIARLIKTRRVRPVGTKRRMRAVVALCGDDELLALAKPKAGTYFSHKGESETNPPGVWTFSRQYRSVWINR